MDMVESFDCLENQFEVVSLLLEFLLLGLSWFGLVFAFLKVLSPNSILKTFRKTKLYESNRVKTRLFSFCSQRSTRCFSVGLVSSRPVPVQTVNYSLIFHQLEWNPSAFGSFCAHYKHEYPGLSAGWWKLRSSYLGETSTPLSYWQWLNCSESPHRTDQDTILRQTRESALKTIDIEHFFSECCTTTNNLKRLRGWKWAQHEI